MCADTKNPLRENLEFYIKHQQELVEKFNGKILLIHSGEVIESFDSKAAAFFAGNSKFEPGTYHYALLRRGRSLYGELQDGTSFFPIGARMPIKCHSFSNMAPGRVVELMSEVGIGLPVQAESFNIEPKKEGLTGIWDTGATGCAITREAAESIGAYPIRARP